MHWVLKRWINEPFYLVLISSLPLKHYFCFEERDIKYKLSFSRGSYKSCVSDGGAQDTQSYNPVRSLQKVHCDLSINLIWMSRAQGTSVAISLESEGKDPKEEIQFFPLETVFLKICRMLWCFKKHLCLYEVMSSKILLQSVQK